MSEDLNLKKGNEFVLFSTKKSGQTAQNCYALDIHQLPTATVKEIIDLDF